ncbi:hypothetical protein BX600DRAFT_457407 [Xylariales sp. PMI_506]|nr:hypothetical protein BX600DRAFT_457407 [Xylariales sp. PMI_506]
MQLGCMELMLASALVMSLRSQSGGTFDDSGHFIMSIFLPLLPFSEPRARLSQLITQWSCFSSLWDRTLQMSQSHFPGSR